MADFFVRIIENGNLIDIISCVFTVMALVFTLYFWLLDHLSEDESKFIEGKSKTLDTLKQSLEVFKENAEEKHTEQMLCAIESVNKKLEVVLNYRFWSRSRQKEEYAKVNEFYRDSKYLVSTLRRFNEKNEEKNENHSLISISELSPDEVEDIRTDYRKGLNYIIEFIENWE